MIRKIIGWLIDITFHENTRAFLFDWVCLTINNNSHNTQPCSPLPGIVLAWNSDNLKLEIRMKERHFIGNPTRHPNPRHRIKRVTDLVQVEVLVSIEERERGKKGKTKWDWKRKEANFWRRFICNHHNLAENRPLPRATSRASSFFFIF